MDAHPHGKEFSVKGLGDCVKGTESHSKEIAKRGMQL